MIFVPKVSPLFYKRRNSNIEYIIMMLIVFEILVITITSIIILVISIERGQVNKKKVL